MLDSKKSLRKLDQCYMDWMSGHTRVDKIRNECIREKDGVVLMGICREDL